MEGLLFPSVQSMLHFTTDKITFGRFGLEILSTNPKLKNIGVDLESAIFSDLKTMILGLRRLICVRHLIKRDESKTCRPSTKNRLKYRRQKTFFVVNNKRYL